MYNDQKVIAIITARGGSKGIPGKNIKKIAGKPLLAWTVEAALGVTIIDRLILSSDDVDIINVAKKFGCEVPFVRPAELASDSSTTVECVLHALNECPGYDWLVVLQPTSPLRAVEDIEGCLKKSIENRAACVTVREASENPCHVFEESAAGFLPLMGWEHFYKRRQDLPSFFIPNGAVYALSTESFKVNQSFYSPDMQFYKMPSSRSVDIDEPLDWIAAEILIKERIDGNKLLG